jgi:hypothetical protein
MDEIFVHEIDIELSVDPITKKEQNYKKELSGIEKETHPSYSKEWNVCFL